MFANTFEVMVVAVVVNYYLNFNIQAFGPSRYSYLHINYCFVCCFKQFEAVVIIMVSLVK